MKIPLLSIGLLFLSSICLAQPQEWLAYKADQKQAWEGAGSKLLSTEQQVNFKGVHYFPYDATLSLSARYEPIRNLDTILVPTTRKTKSQYLIVGKIYFTIKDANCSLVVYRGLDPWSEMDKHFVMFNDLTNGESTYGGGRYLELQQVDEAGGKAILDFNYSYNPYCAYADRYSCPIPPKENRLEVEVRAGVGY